MGPSRLFAQLEKAGRKLFEQMAKKPNQTARYGDARKMPYLHPRRTARRIWTENIPGQRQPADFLAFVQRCLAGLPVLKIGLAAGTPTLEICGAAGTTCRIDYCTNMPPTAWWPLMTNTPTTESTNFMDAGRYQHARQKLGRAHQRCWGDSGCKHRARGPAENTPEPQNR